MISLMGWSKGMGVLDVRCQYGNMDDRILDGSIVRRPDPCFDLSINYGVLSVHPKRHLTTYPQNLNHPGFMFLLLLWGTMRKTSPTSLQNLRSVHWLIGNRVPALFGIDPRALTKKSEKGCHVRQGSSSVRGPSHQPAPTSWSHIFYHPFLQHLTRGEKNTCSFLRSKPKKSCRGGFDTSSRVVLTDRTNTTPSLWTTSAHRCH